MPIDPVELASGESPRNTPEFIDENPNRDLILEGMDLAEEERREAIEDITDDSGEDDFPMLSDDDDEEVAPEIAAIHRDHSPGAE